MKFLNLFRKKKETVNEVKTQELSYMQRLRLRKSRYSAEVFISFDGKPLRKFNTEVKALSRKEAINVLKGRLSFTIGNVNKIKSKSS